MKVPNPSAFSSQIICAIVTDIQPAVGDNGDDL
jgi:hypothetical protein